MRLQLHQTNRYICLMPYFHCHIFVIIFYGLIIINFYWMMKYHFMISIKITFYYFLYYFCCHKSLVWHNVAGYLSLVSIHASLETKAFLLHTLMKANLMQPCSDLTVACFSYNDYILDVLKTFQRLSFCHKALCGRLE